MFWKIRNCNISDSNFQTLGPISAFVSTHLERVGDLVSPPRPRPQRPQSRGAGFQKRSGKDVKARGGWWRGGEGAAGRAAKTQNAQHGSPRQTPSTGRQLGSEDSGEEQRKKVRWQPPREVETYRARRVLRLQGRRELLLTLRSEPQPETPGGAGLGCQRLQLEASGIKSFPSSLATIPELAPAACGSCTPLPGQRASAKPLPRCLFPEQPGPSPPPPRLQRARTPPPEAHSLVSRQREWSRKSGRGQLEKIRLKSFSCAIRFKELFASIFRLH